MCSGICTCNDENITMCIKCYKCKIKWSSPLTQIEKINICPSHYKNIKNCPKSSMNSICFFINPSKEFRTIFTNISFLFFIIKIFINYFKFI